jgi:hypothetical protein
VASDFGTYSLQIRRDYCIINFKDTLGLIRESRLEIEHPAACLKALRVVLAPGNKLHSTCATHRPPCPFSPFLPPSLLIQSPIGL